MGPLALLLGQPATAGALTLEPHNAAVEPDTLMVVAVVDGLDPQRWLKEPPPFAQWMARHGGIGLINVRTDGSPNAASAHLTVGAGGRSRAGDDAGLAFNRDEHYLGLPAGAVYAVRTRTATTAATPSSASAPDLPAVVHLAWAEQQGLNEGRPYGSQPGWLGERWRAAGRRVAVVGNADVPGTRRRYGVLLAAGKDGTVPLGDVSGDLSVTDRAFPFGPRTDYARTLEAVIALAGEADVIVIELGDVSRLRHFRRHLTASAYDAFERQALVDIDRFLARLTAALQERETNRSLSLWLISPTPGPSQQEGGITLAPVAWATLPPKVEAGGAAIPADGGEGGRLLYSSRTRRPGLITAEDVTAWLAVVPSRTNPLPSVAPAALIAQLPRTGFPRDGAATEDAWSALSAFSQRAVSVSRQRLPVLRGYILCTIGSLLGWSAWMVAAAWAGRRGNSRWYGPAWVRLWRNAFLAVTAVPLALLLLPLWHSDTLAVTVVRLAALALLSVGIASWRVRDLSSPAPFIRLSAATALLLIVDLFRNAVWMKHSLLGYDPILGSRFYGMGNEYMGIFVGSALVASTSGFSAFENRRPLSARRWALVPLAVVYFAAVVLLAWPTGGTNVGGAITAAFAFGTTVWKLATSFPYVPVSRAGPRLFVTPVAAGALALLVIGLLGTIGWYDAFRGGQSAHLGQFVAATVEGGWDVAADVFARKLETNVRLFRYTIWSRVLVLSLGIFGALLLWAPGVLRPVVARYPRLAAGLQGTVVGSIVALLVNDSGVVAAATTMIPATGLLLFLVAAQAAKAS